MTLEWLRAPHIGHCHLRAPHIGRCHLPMPELVPSWVPEAGMFFVIGVSGWWSENAMQWAESPIFVEKTPEKAAIGNLLSVACACGNIFPFVYTKLLPSDTQTKILPAVVIICQAIAVIAALGVGFGWQETITVGGTEYSYLLLGGTFLAAGVGTLSNVTYWALALRCDGVHPAPLPARPSAVRVVCRQPLTQSS